MDFDFVEFEKKDKSTFTEDIVDIVYDEKTQERRIYVRGRVKNYVKSIFNNEKI